VSDLLGVVRGDAIASVATYSGAYFSNADNVATLGTMSGFVSWPEPTSENAYAQLLIHGGENDTYPLGMVTIHFDTFATNDTSYLNNLGHDVVLCDHGQGHTAPVAGLGSAQIIEFFADHPRWNTTSPYRVAGLPEDFPGYCELRPRE
jgi:hypothetical protein